eukprot:Filipodium_phascolosomae@DN4852_c0_g1_i1.p1
MSQLYKVETDALTSEKYLEPLGKGYCPEKSDSRGKGRFSNKVAIITGGAGNFGEQCARRMMSEGATVVLFDLKDPKPVAEKLMKEISGAKAAGYECDVTDEKSVQKAVGEVVTNQKRIDMLFNNAGYQGDFKPTDEYNVDDFRKVVDINLTGVFIVMKTVANAMKAQSPRGGVIVNTASMAGVGVPPNMCAYAASKAAVKHMTIVASKDLAPRDIRVCSVSPALIGPGFMWTRQVELQAKAGSKYFNKDPKEVCKQMVGGVPMERYGSIDEVIGPVLFLLSDDAGYLTGIDIQIHGGLTA